MIEIGKNYIFKHCKNDGSEWNGRVVTIRPGGFEVPGPNGVDLFYNAIREDGVTGWVLEEELIGEYS